MRLITGSRSPKNQKGLAMVFTIFLAVGLQTLIVGSMMNMMRHDREVQRISHQNQAQWIADAVTERALKLLADHIKVTDQLPTPTVMNSFFGSSPVANGRSFTWFLIQDWYNTYFRSRYPMASRIAVSNVYFRTISAGGSRGTYAIEVTVQNYESKAKAISSQQVSVTTGRLFDYAVFYDEDLEIAGGPSMTLQGPLFSNKNVYLMNDDGSTLRLLRSKDFSDQGNPEPYVLHSGGNIYFHLKRMMGKNYLLDGTTPGGAAFLRAIEDGGMPAYYNTKDRTLYPPGDGAELFGPSYTASPTDGREFHTFPAYYQVSNGTALGTNNTIQVEDAGGSMVTLAPPIPTRTAYYSPFFSFYYEYSTYDSQPLGSSMSVASAIDPRNFPALDPSWTQMDPKSDPPPVNPLWHGVGTVVLERQPKKTIPIGDPTLGAHILIEPLQAGDSNEVRAMKFQSKADLDFTSLDGGLTITEKNGHLTALEGIGAVRLMNLYDYRIEGCYRTLEIDIGKAADYAASTAIMGNDGLLIYIETTGGPFTRNQSCGSGSMPEMVKLVNGSKVPESGMTVATNGRLWIQGDYNTYSYSLMPQRNCTSAEWNSENCDVPGTAIFSDSFGVLSNEWSDAYGPATPMANRVAASDVMVNAAVVTGSLVSGLEKTLPNCSTDPAGCERNPGQDFFSCFSGLNPDGTPVNPGSCHYYRAPQTPNPSYPGTPGVYYLNPYSDLYRQMTTLCACSPGGPASTCPAGTRDACVDIIDPRIDPSNPNRWSKIPIYSDSAANPADFSGFPSAAEPAGIRPFPGVYYARLGGQALITHDNHVCHCTVQGGCTFVCNDPSPAPCPDGVACAAQHSCRPPVAEGGSYTCIWSGCINPAWGGGQFICDQYDVVGQLRYDFPPDAIPLYSPKYSGGFENLVNLQELWTSARSLRLSGVLSSPWQSSGLYYTAGTPAYYNQSGGAFPSYYGAPERLLDYNENLRDNPPPATPGVFSVRRERWNLKRG